MAPSLARDALALTSGFISKPTIRDKFQQLVEDLSGILGSSSGLTSEDVDVGHLEELMKNYISNESEWHRYAFADMTRGYTRNLVDEGNGKSNLLILVWTPGKGSPIHDHADAHCLMKVLRGSVLETRFSYPDQERSTSKLEVIKETTYNEGEVTYMADELGLHKISNPDQKQLAVSLHLYTPPNAARTGCNIFCENTGKRSHVMQCNFFSVFGHKTDL